MPRGSTAFLSHLPATLAERMDREIGRAVRAVDVDDTLKVTVALQVTVEYDQDEGEVAITAAEKGGHARKTSWNPPRPEQPGLFDEDSEIQRVTISDGHREVTLTPEQMEQVAERLEEELVGPPA